MPLKGRWGLGDHTGCWNDTTGDGAAPGGETPWASGEHHVGGQLVLHRIGVEGVGRSSPRRPTCCIQVCPNVSTKSRHTRSQHPYTHPYKHPVTPLSAQRQGGIVLAELHGLADRWA